MTVPVYAHIATCSYVLPLCLAFHRQEHISQEWRLLPYYFGFILVVIFFEWSLGAHHINNIWLTHLTTITDFTVYVFLYVLWEKKQALKRGLQFLLVAFFLLWIVSKIYFEPLTSFDSFTKPLSDLLLCLVSGYVLIRESLQEGGFLPRRPMFWFSSATLLYSTGSLLPFLYGNFLLKLPLESIVMVWYINWTTVILSNLFYAGVFLCDQH